MTASSTWFISALQPAFPAERERGKPAAVVLRPGFPLCGRLQSSPEADFVCAPVHANALSSLGLLTHKCLGTQSGSKRRAKRGWGSQPAAGGQKLNVMQLNCLSCCLSKSKDTRDANPTRKLKHPTSYDLTLVTWQFFVFFFFSKDPWDDGLMRAEWTKEIGEFNCPEVPVHQRHFPVSKSTHGPCRVKWQNSFSKAHKLPEAWVKI